MLDKLKYFKTVQELSDENMNFTSYHTLKISPYLSMCPLLLRGCQRCIMVYVDPAEGVVPLAEHKQDEI